MKARNSDAAAKSKSASTRSLQASASDSTRHGRAETGKTEEGHSVATWKNYADSRLRQFCLR